AGRNHNELCSREILISLGEAPAAWEAAIVALYFGFLPRGSLFMLIARSLLALSLAALFSSAALAQHKDVPFRGGIPIAPSGLADKPLADGPFDYATGEGQNIRVTVLTKALS